MSEHKDNKGNLINGDDCVLDFVMQVTHGGFYHKKWLIKAAFNYIDGKDIHFENEKTPECP